MCAVHIKEPLTINMAAWKPKDHQHSEKEKYKINTNTTPIYPNPVKNINISKHLCPLSAGFCYKVEDIF